jgi:hypothetical protein
MAYAPLSSMNIVVGSFIEKDHGKNFEYIENPNKVFHVPAHGGSLVEFPHLIFVGPRGEETRQALVLKTCAHVVVDETKFGFVVEKWNIKNHRKYGKIRT